MTAIYEKVTVIGIGLVGASLALAVRHHQAADHIICYDKSQAARDEAKQIGIGDKIADTLEEAVHDSDLVVLAVPVGVMGKVMEDIAPYLKAGAVVTDTGSTKASVLRDVMPHLPKEAIFIAGHPMAGTEFSGPSAGFISLFKDKYWLLVPNGSERSAVDKLRSLLEIIGAIVEEMDVKYHDKVVAITSHLPHLIAYTIVGTAIDLESDLKDDVIRFSASGFRDFTRIAASDPTMWRDVFLNNDEAVLEMLQRFSEDLSYLQRAIRWHEGDKLFDLFTRTRDIRKSIIEAGQD